MLKKKKYYKWVYGSFDTGNGIIYYSRYKKHFWSRWRYAVDVETNGLPERFSRLK